MGASFLDPRGTVKLKGSCNCKLGSSKPSSLSLGKCSQDKTIHFLEPVSTVNSGPVSGIGLDSAFCTQSLAFIHNLPIWEKFPQEFKAVRKVRLPVWWRLAVNGHVFAEVVQERVEDFAQDGSVVDNGGRIIHSFQ